MASYEVHFPNKVHNLLQLLDQNEIYKEKFLLLDRDYIVTCMGDSWLGFGLDIVFIDHLQAVDTNIYNNIANLHTLAMSSPVVPS